MNKKQLRDQEVKKFQRMVYEAEDRRPRSKQDIIKAQRKIVNKLKRFQ